MEEAKRKIEVCDRSLDLARQHHASGSFLRAFAHYLIHKNVLWELNDDEKESLKEKAKIEEIVSTFEKVKLYFKKKLEKEESSSVWNQWKATNEQFLDLLGKTLKEETKMCQNNSEDEEHQKEYESISNLIISHSTDHAVSLFKKGQYLEACQVFDNFLSVQEMMLNPNTLPAKETRNRISNLAVDRWHFTMLNDQMRNDAYKMALEEVLQSFPNECPKVRILDVGTGTGLLSLYAKDASNKFNIDASITACEASTPMAEIAAKVFELNQLPNENVADKIKDIELIRKLSTHISPSEVPKNSINVLVTETFDAGLLGEHILETLDHAFKNLLSKDCTIIPCRASVYISLIECQAVANRTKMTRKNVGSLSFEEITITAKELEEEPYTSERLDSLPGGYKFISQDCGEKLIDINFENPEQIQEYLKNGRTFQRRIQCRLKKEHFSSQVDALILWFELHLLDKNKWKKDLRISTKPIQRQNSKDRCCWEQAIFPLMKPFKVQNGDEVEVKINLKGHFSLESCEKIKKNGSSEDTISKLNIELRSEVIEQLNDSNVQQSFYLLSQNINLSIGKHEKWNGRKKIDILDFTETCLVSLQLLALNQMNSITVAQATHADNDEEEDITKNNFAMRIQYDCEVALSNKLKMSNIDCVMSLDQVPDRSYDLVLLELIDHLSGKLNQENLLKLPIFRNKLRDSPDSMILPSKLTVNCQLVQSFKLERMSFVDDKNVHGLKLASVMNQFSVNHLQDLDLNSVVSYHPKNDPLNEAKNAGKMLSEPLKVFDFDLMTLSSSDIVKKDFEICISDNGTANGIAYWFTQHYGCDVTMSNYENSNIKVDSSNDESLNMKKQACITFSPPGISVAKDDSIKFTFLYSNGLIDFVRAKEEYKNENCQ